MTPSDLQTTRLLLRKPQPDDAPRIFQSYGQDVEVTRYLMWRPHNDLNDAEEAVQRFRDGWKRGTRFTWLMFDRENGELAGSIAARQEKDGVNLGYLLVRAFWGRGLMVEAIEAVVQWAFDDPSVFSDLGGLRRGESSFGACAGEDRIRL